MEFRRVAQFASSAGHCYFLDAASTVRYTYNFQLFMKYRRCLKIKYSIKERTFCIRIQDKEESEYVKSNLYNLCMLLEKCK